MTQIGQELTPIDHDPLDKPSAGAHQTAPKIRSTMELASPDSADHDVNFMIDAIWGEAANLGESIRGGP